MALPHYIISGKFE